MKILVIGAGGHAKVVVATAQAAGWAVAGLYDDDPALWGKSLLGVPVVGPTTCLRPDSETHLVAAVGDNRTRERLVHQFSHARWATIVHPRALIHESVSLGEGTVVFGGAVLQPMVKVGKHAIVNTGAIIEHDCRLGDFVHVAPGARLAGGVVVEDRCLIGIGASVLPMVKIAEDSVIGAGSVVVRDIPPRSVAYGVPAMVRREQR
jgi:sugar O-acyltransferase (sialic acid O-acetyltransferase NeuD family)